MSRRKNKRKRVEQRAMSYGPVPINDSHTLFGNYPMTSTGIRVDNYSADCNYVFRRGVEVIAQSLAKICRKWRLIKEDDNGDKSPVKDIHTQLMTRRANGYTTAYNFWELIQSWAKGWGNGYAWILRRNDMTPIGLYPLHPSRVQPRITRGDSNEEPWQVYYQIDGGRETFLPYEILHIKGNPGFDGVTGYNIVQLHENTLAIAQAQNEFTGEFFANGAVAGGLVELPSHLKPDVIVKYQKDFQDRYSSRGNRHKLAIVDSGVKFTATTIDPTTSQLLDGRKFSIYEIAMMLGVPPTVLGDLSHGTFNNTEQQQISLNTLTIHPIAENWRQELDVKMTPPLPDDAGEEYSWEYETALKSLDAADTNTRTTYLKTAIGGPWMSPEEGRVEDGLPQEVNGKIYPPANMTAPPESLSPSVAKPGDKASPSENEMEDKPAENRSLPVGPAYAGQGDVSGAAYAIVAARQKSAKTLESIFLDAADRIMAKETRGIGGLVKHLREARGDMFESKVGEFYDKHETHVADNYTPALRSLATQTAHAVAEERRADVSFSAPDNPIVAGYAVKLAQRHCQFAKESIRKILAENHDAAQAADAVESRLAHWKSNRAARESDYELHQAQNYFTLEAYRAAGCASLRWVAHPDDPVECRALDGKVVPIDEPFSNDPLRRHPPFGGECRCGIVGI